MTSTIDATYTTPGSEVYTNSSFQVTSGSAISPAQPDHHDPSADYGLSVMAQVVLNRDSLELTPLDSSVLETVVATAQATVGHCFYLFSLGPNIWL